MAERKRVAREILKEQNSLQRHVCAGLDTNIRTVQELIKAGLKLSLRAHATAAETALAYNRMVIDTTADIVATYKPNAAFTRSLGYQGSWVMKKTIEYAHQNAPQALVIEDAKIADIDSTNDHYVEEIFGYHKADAVTIHPLLGKEALTPFLDRRDKLMFVLARTSNKGAGEFQDIETPHGTGFRNVWRPLYEIIASNVTWHWNDNRNVGLVVGATYPEEAEKIRKDVVGANIPLLIPGVGAQGGEAKDIVPLALRRGDLGVINSSRGLIFAKRQEGERFEDAIRRAALKLHNEIVAAQNKAA